MAWYVDTSAAVKLVVRESGSTALRRWMGGRDGRLVASDLVRTELLRTARRHAPDQVVRAREVLEVLVLLTMPTAVFERAALIEPLPLRSLDALHLAAALELGDELEGIVTYDDRLADAAGAVGVPVVAPR